MNPAMLCWHNTGTGTDLVLPGLLLVLFILPTRDMMVTLDIYVYLISLFDPSTVLCVKYNAGCVSEYFSGTLFLAIRIICVSLTLIAFLMRATEIEIIFHSKE